MARENFNFTQFATTYFNGKAPVGGNMFQVEYENPQGRRRLDGAMDGVAEVITGWGGGVEGEGARFWRLDGEPPKVSPFSGVYLYYECAKVCPGPFVLVRVPQ